MRETFKTLRNRMESLFWKIAAEQENVTVDGVPGFNDKAQFTNGKVIYEGAFVVCDLLAPEQKPLGMARLREMIHFCAQMPFETWGILYALEGIYRLEQHGLLAETVSPEDIEYLKTALDWRSFVDEEHDFALIHKPTNYYGVAFGIARYRELLHWEPVRYSELLLTHLTEHISRYSGEYGFMDETMGCGRFDRYSILIPAEITELVLSTHWEEPELIRRMLNCSAHICLRMASTRGTGFSYGRSIGAYGDAAVLQILSTAIALGGILTPEEETLAHGYCCSLVRSLVHFWYDERMQSINMWEHGRRTDGYRNKNRILGENLSLSMQIIMAEEQWNRRGWTLEEEPQGWQALMEKLPKVSLTRFADEPLPRSLVIFRDGDKVWSLPVISGGTDYMDRDPYLPVPRCNFLLEAVPDCTHGAWLPCLELKNGDVLVPAGYVDETQLTENGTGCTVQLHQKGFIRNGVRPVEQEMGTEIDTVYTFAPGEITRQDILRIAPELLPEVACIRLECEWLSGQVQAEGYEAQTNQRPEDICLDTPHGRCTGFVRYERRTLPEDGVLQLSWTYRY